MRSNKNSVITIFSLFLAVILTAMLGSGNVRADDVDVYVTSAKNSAMVVIDDSGSMSWPVYEAGFDYSNFMYWMVEQGLANDSKTLGENLLGNRKADNDFWDKDKDNFSPRYSGRTKNKDKEYDRLDPDQIYLVSSPVWLGEVTYTDSGGQTKTVSQLDDVLAHASSHNERDDWLDNPIVVLRNAAGDVWRLPPVPGEDTGEDTGEIILDTQVDLKDLTIEVETVSEGGEDKYYILFPTTTLDICEDELPEGCKSSDKWYSVTNTFGGQRLKTNQDVRLTNLVVDPRTGIVTDYGFLGALRTAGYYFAGVFEKSGGDIDFTDNVAEAETVGGVARVYVFATGRWLNFIKLVEDFQADSPGTPTDTTWTFQETLAWTNKHL